ncbi:EthD domain-containing protein [Streptomyces sp. NPDC007896]|uniref:EthD domain-containing protein n=1 Tax=Streptomyces sp. NPDC007896 TaxID=3364784 RepID=UPI0036E21B30
MIKLVAAVRRRPGITHAEYAEYAEYVEYVEKVHGGIALADRLTVRKYVQNHVLDGAYGMLGDTGYQATLPRDSVTELYFDDLASMGRTFDPYAREVIGPDAVNFSDQPSALSLLVEESEAEAPRPGDGRVKVLHFLKAADGITPEAFRKGLRRAYEEVLADSSGPARYLRGHQWNTPLPGDGIRVLRKRIGTARVRRLLRPLVRRGGRPDRLPRLSAGLDRPRGEARGAPSALAVLLPRHSGSRDLR